MDKNSIATLLDYQASIERSFRKIEKALGNYESSEISIQHQLMTNMDKELLNIKNNGRNRRTSKHIETYLILNNNL